MYVYIYIYMYVYVYIYIYIYIYMMCVLNFPIRRGVKDVCTKSGRATANDDNRRHINGVVSNGVVPKSQIGKLASKPAPEICIGSCFVPDVSPGKHQKCNRFGFGGIKRPF